MGSATRRTDMTTKKAMTRIGESSFFKDVCR
jgi:hypothetical protein